MEIKFIDAAHKAFYQKYIAETNSHDDPYRKAFFYTLGLADETRRNINMLYNFGERCIDWNGLKAGFQTGTTIKVCRLAFNLYNGLHGEQSRREKAANYTPYELFDCSLMEFMFEAVRIRFQEYSRLPF